MARLITARYNGKCKRCSKRLAAGDTVLWLGRGRGIACDSVNCAARFEANDAPEFDDDTEVRFAGTDIAIGAARAEHIRDTRNFFGEAAAAAEELAWEMRDPSY